MKEPLKLHEFFEKFANTPIEKRSPILILAIDSPIREMNLFQIYESLKFLEGEIRWRRIRQDRLLKAVSEFM